MPYSELRVGRTSLAGHTYHITTATHQRRAYFSDLYTGRLLAQALQRQDCIGNTQTLAYVIMPDHLHWLFTLIGKQSLVQVVKQVKGQSAQCIIRATDQAGPIWQPSFHDHAVRSDESLVEIARYIIMNPVRAGLVLRPGDYSLWDAKWF